MKRNHRESLQEWNIHSWWLCCGPALSGCVNNNLSHCNPFICNLLNVCALLCMRSAQSAQSSSLYARLCPGLCRRILLWCALKISLKHHWLLTFNEVFSGQRSNCFPLPQNSNAPWPHLIFGAIRPRAHSQAKVHLLFWQSGRLAWKRQMRRSQISKYTCDNRQ